MAFGQADGVECRVRASGGTQSGDNPASLSLHTFFAEHEQTDRTKLDFLKKQGLYDPANEKDSCGVGFVANLKARADHQNVLDALEMLVNMEHRGGCGCEPNTGDGAGILVGLPEGFLRTVAKEDLRVDLPEKGRYGAGLVFLPKDDAEQRAHRGRGRHHRRARPAVPWLARCRRNPIPPMSARRRAVEPYIMQLFIGAADGLEGDDFERQL